MNDSSHVLTVPEVRAKLDAVIAFATTRADARLESAAKLPAGTDNRREIALAEHALGRLAGLLEARELLDCLEAPAPNPTRRELGQHPRGVGGIFYSRPRTVESDLKEDR